MNKVASVLRQLAERAVTQPFDFDGHNWQRHEAVDFARWLVNRATEVEHGTLTVPESVAIPARFTSSDVTDFGTDARPPSARLPESLGGTAEEVEEVEELDEHGAEIDDHLRDIRQGLLTITAELDQIGQSTQALMSSRLYWIEFTEGPEGPDFAGELAEVGTKVRHLQRILAAAERASSS